MRVLQQKDVSPIHLHSGDSLTLTHDDGAKVTELLTETFSHTRVVDRVAVVELEGDELQALALEEGIAGVFGKRKPDAAPIGANGVQSGSERGQSL